jgi:hypothetical protein
MTFNSATFSSLGLTPGAYTWFLIDPPPATLFDADTFPTGDTITLNIVPIPAALPLFATGVAAVAYAGRRKRKAAQAAG